MKIILGVTGSISAYKAYDICRELIKAEHEVKVVLTRGSLEFINPKTFYYLGASQTFSPDDDFNAKKFNSQEVLHINLCRWADRIVIAPLSANTLNSLGQGKASNLLENIVLASWDKSILLFPAMNTKMLENPITQLSLNNLKKYPQLINYGSQVGTLLCKEQGEGKLLDTQEIVALIETTPLKIESKKVLITTGATQSPIDPIRFLTNASSGKTGLHLMREFLSKGYQVTLVAGRDSIAEIDLFKRHPRAKIIRVYTTREMSNVVKEYFESSDIYISSAAINDFEFETSNEKIKKNNVSDQLLIKRTPDILKEVLSTKRHQKIIGFAAETKLDEKIIQDKLQNKQVDLLVANQVHGGNIDRERMGFSQNGGDYYLYEKNHLIESKKLSKQELAKYIFKWCEANGSN